MSEYRLDFGNMSDGREYRSILKANSTFFSLLFDSVFDRAAMRSIPRLRDKKKRMVELITEFYNSRGIGEVNDKNEKDRLNLTIPKHLKERLRVFVENERGDKRGVLGDTITEILEEWLVKRETAKAEELFKEEEQAAYMRDIKGAAAMDTIQRSNRVDSSIEEWERRTGKKNPYRDRDKLIEEVKSQIKEPDEILDEYEKKTGEKSPYKGRDPKDILVEAQGKKMERLKSLCDGRLMRSEEEVQEMILKDKEIKQKMLEKGLQALRKKQLIERILERSRTMEQLLSNTDVRTRAELYKMEEMKELLEKVNEFVDMYIEVFPEGGSMYLPGVPDYALSSMFEEVEIEDYIDNLGMLIKAVKEVVEEKMV